MGGIWHELAASVSIDLTPPSNCIASPPPSPSFPRTRESIGSAWCTGAGKHLDTRVRGNDEVENCTPVRFGRVDMSRAQTRRAPERVERAKMPVAREPISAPRHPR